MNLGEDVHNQIVALYEAWDLDGRPGRFNTFLNRQDAGLLEMLKLLGDEVPKLPLKIRRALGLVGKKETKKKDSKAKSSRPKTLPERLITKHFSAIAQVYLLHVDQATLSLEQYVEQLRTTCVSEEDLLKTLENAKKRT